MLIIFFVPISHTPLLPYLTQPSPPRHPDIMYHLHHRVLQGGDDSVPKNVQVRGLVFLHGTLMVFLLCLFRERALYPQFISRVFYRTYNSITSPSSLLKESSIDGSSPELDNTVAFFLIILYSLFSYYYLFKPHLSELTIWAKSSRSHSEPLREQESFPLRTR